MCRATLDKCYAGGSITSTSTAPHTSSPDKGTNIWAGGLVGGIMLRYQGGFSTLVGAASNELLVQNSYSFVRMPASGSKLIRTSHAIASNGEMQASAFGTVTNPNAVIKNCYALADTVGNTDDYQNNRDRTGWTGGVDLNAMTGAGKASRPSTLYNNGRSPYISYAQMQTDLRDWLNSGIADAPYFDAVTVEENGARIDGKYSFPGADAQRLNGLNYPFPTILTQQDAYDRTVCVHYGAWPMYGLYWESASTVLDLFADRGGSGSLPSLTVALYPESSAISTGSMPDITFWNEDGSEADGSLIGAASVARYDAARRCWPVTFTASGTGNEGVVIARAAISGFTAQLTIRVGAVLELSNDKPNGLTVYYGGPAETVTLSLRDSRGVPVTADAAQGQLITWAVSAEQLADGTAIVECSKDDIQSVAGKAGAFTLPVKAFAAGDSSITVTCTYIYLENGAQKSIAASTLLSARSVRDAVGLVYDVQEDTALHTAVTGVYLPYTGAPESTDGSGVTAPVFDRQAGGLYLFAGKGYTELSDFYVDFSGLTATDSAGDPADDWTIRVGDVTEADDCRFRRLTVEMGEPRRLTLHGTVLLTRDGATYRLPLTDYVCGTDPETPTT